MFDALQDRLQGTFKRLRGEGKISEEVLQSALRDIRLALLEADVHFAVTRKLLQAVEESAREQQVLESLSPAQQVVKIVRDELAKVLGEPGTELTLKGRPAVLLLCGLQGSGKTTTAGKLARRLISQGRYPLLVAADLQRAAAVEQLRQVGAAVDVPMVEPEEGDDVISVARRGIERARSSGRDVVIVDTAGRLHIDDELMAEISQLAEVVEPAECLLVADAMTGQDAVNSAGAFAGAVHLTGVILTKLDGDSRGGAAISISSVTGVRIRFVGTGEKPDDLELFDPERLASRVTGLGDVMALIEKAEQGLDREQSRDLAERISKAQFTLEDLRNQLRQMRKLGPLGQVLEMLPRQAVGQVNPADIDESRLKVIEAIIDSMTPFERRTPTVLNASRKRRIARGSGTTVQDINQLIKQHREMKKMLKSVRGGWMKRFAPR